MRENRTIWVLSSAFFFIFMGAGAFQQFFLPYLQGRTGWGEVKCAIILGTVYFTFLFWRIFALYSIKLLGDFYSVFLGSVTYTAAAAVFGISTNYTALLVMAVCWSWGAASLWIASSSLILDSVSPTRYGRASGIFYTACSVGFLIGLVLLGKMHTLYQGEGLVLSAVTITVLGNILAMALPAKTTTREMPSPRAVLATSVGRVGRLIGIFQFTSSLGFGLLLSVFAIEIKARFGMGSIAAITLSFYIMRSLGSLAGGRASDWLGRGAVLRYGFLIAAAGLILPSLYPSSLTLACGGAALGLLAGVVPVSAMSIAGDASDPERRPAMVAAMFVWRDLGVAVAIVLGTYLRNYMGGFQAPFFIFAALFVLCAIISLALPEVRKPESA